MPSDAVKHGLSNGFSTLQVLHNDALQQRRRYPRVPDAFGINDDDGTIAAYAKTRRFASLDPRGAEQQVFALEQLGEERV